jgi:hypothetical protein
MWNESAVLVVCTIEKDMRTLKVSLIASAIGTAVGLGTWIFGLGEGELFPDAGDHHCHSDCVASFD